MGLRSVCSASLCCHHLHHHPLVLHLPELMFHSGRMLLLLMSLRRVAATTAAASRGGRVGMRRLRVMLHLSFRARTDRHTQDKRQKAREPHRPPLSPRMPGLINFIDKREAFFRAGIPHLESCPMPVDRL
jgi:hypothetical protein